MKEHQRKFFTKVGWLLFYLYIILLCYFLFFSERYGRDYMTHGYRYNLEFFKEIKRFITYREQLGFETFAVNILGNILAFAPYGYFLPLLNKNYRKFIPVLLLSLLFSSAVEVMQLYLRVGIFDVDDILLNTAGGVVGYILFLIWNQIYKRYFTNKKRKGKKYAKAKKR